MPIIAPEHLIPIDELYIGKLPELEEVEKYIDKLRRKYDYNPSDTRCCTDEYTLKINRIFEKLFGFENFALVFDTSKTINAYTIPISLSSKDEKYNPKNAVYSDEKGFHYKKESKVCGIVVVYLSLFMNQRLSPADIVAIILHEIGHNFQIAISSIQYPQAQYVAEELSFIQRVVVSVGVLFNYLKDPSSVANRIHVITLNSKTEAKGLEKIINKYKKELESNNVLVRAKNRYLGIISSFTGKITDIIKFKNRVKLTLKFMLSSKEKAKYDKALKLYKNADKYKNNPKKLKDFAPVKFKYSKVDLDSFKGETLADNFATIYGYGSNSANFNLYFSDVILDTDEGYNKFLNSTFGQYYKAMMLPTYLATYLTDEHPNELFRCLDQVNYLKQELHKKDLDPKMKKEIIRQIDEIESATNKIYKNIDEKNDNMVFRKMVAYTVYKICDGDPRSDYVKNNFKEIEEAYNKYLEED